MKEKLKNWAKDHKKEIAWTLTCTTIGYAVGYKFGSPKKDVRMLSDSPVSVKTLDELHALADDLMREVVKDPELDVTQPVQMILHYETKK